SDTGDVSGDLAQVRAAFTRRCVTDALHPSRVGVQHTASDRRLGNSRRRFRYPATYFSHSADWTRRAMVATAGVLPGSDLLRLLESPSVRPSGRLVAASHAQACGSRERSPQQTAA